LLPFSFLPPFSCKSPPRPPVHLNTAEAVLLIFLVEGFPRCLILKCPLDFLPLFWFGFFERSPPSFLALFIAFSCSGVRTPVNGRVTAYFFRFWSLRPPARGGLTSKCFPIPHATPGCLLSKSPPPPSRCKSYLSWMCPLSFVFCKSFFPPFDRVPVAGASLAQFSFFGFADPPTVIITWSTRFPPPAPFAPPSEFCIWSDLFF